MEAPVTLDLVAAVARFVALFLFIIFNVIQNPRKVQAVAFFILEARA